MLPTRAGVAILVILAVRCEPSLGYEVVVRNTGNRDVDNVRVSYGRFVDEPGVIPPRIHSGHLDVQEPLPVEAVVEWRDADGETHRQVVRVMPRSDFRGVLVFEIDAEDRVKVSTETPPRY